MGGPGSGRQQAPGSVPYVPQMTHSERALRRRKIADHAAEHGVKVTADLFDIADSSVYEALRRCRMKAAREIRSQSGARMLHILKRMAVDGDSAAEAAQILKVTLGYANKVRREAVAVGFVFQEKLHDAESRVCMDAATADSGERGESPAVG